MDLSAIFNAVRAPGQDRGADDPFSALRVGDHLTGRVLRVEADGRALIDLGRFQALAHTTMAVQPGQLLQLQVARTGVPLQLKLDAESLAPGRRPIPQLAVTQLLAGEDRQRLVAVIERLLASATAVTDAGSGGRAGQVGDAVRQALAHLKGLFEPLPAIPSTEQLAHWVRTAIEDRGILFEIKMADALAAKASVLPDAVTDSLSRAVQNIILRDLKPQLLILNAYLGADETAATDTAFKAKDAAFLRRAVAHLLTHVTGQQERAVQRAGGQDLYQVLAHLLPDKEGRQPVHLKVYYPKRDTGGQGQPGHRIALLLDMDRLGPVRVDLFMTGNDLSINFYVRDDMVRQHLEQHTAVVAQALEGHFEHVQVAAHVSREAIVRFATEDSDCAAAGRIDIKA